jgi:regulator of RNase E activity RraA
VTVYSTPEVLQAAGGAARFVRGLTPIGITTALCGPAATGVCAPGDNLAVHRLIEQAIREMEDDIRIGLVQGTRLSESLDLPA